MEYAIFELKFWKVLSIFFGKSCFADCFGQFDTSGTTQGKLPRDHLILFGGLSGGRFGVSGVCVCVRVYMCVCVYLPVCVSPGMCLSLLHLDVGLVCACLSVIVGLCGASVCRVTSFSLCLHVCLHVCACACLCK